MNATSTTGNPRLVLVEVQPWYVASPTSVAECRRDLEDERLLLAVAVGDHLPVEVAARAADLTAQLDGIA